MNKRGITELSHSAGGGGTVRLADLEAFTVFVVPRQQHVIELEYSRFGLISQLAEMVGTDDDCSHNFLKCKISGIIVDLSLGQFTGTMTPLVFGSMEEYLPAIPGDVLHVEACPQNVVDEQLKLDSASWKREASPGSVPSAFAKRVVRCAFNGEQHPHCFHCFGTASPALKRCTRCGVALYCSKHCQILHWKMHKKECVPSKINSEQTSKQTL